MNKFPRMRDYSNHEGHSGVYRFRTVMKPIRFLVFLPILLTALSCMDKDQEALDIFAVNYDFTQGEGQWTAGFSDYAVPATPDEAASYDWVHYYGDSAKACKGQKVHMLSCNNVSGDVFMYLKTKVTGLRASTNYNLVFDITVASNSVAGQGVILKVGGSDVEPQKIAENNYYYLNIDKGNNIGSGQILISLGDIGASASGVDNYEYLDKNNASSYSPLVARTNDQGELWLVVGTDSLLQGYNAVFYSKINVVFSVSE